MSLSKLLLTTVTLILVSNYSSFARIKIPVGTQEVLKETADLPDTEEFLLRNGHYLDLATLHEEYTIAYVPIWITKDPIIVGYDKLDDTYYEIPDNELEAIITEQKLNKSELLSLPFFNKYGGKVIALLIISLIIYGMLPSKKDKVDAQEV